MATMTNSRRALAVAATLPLAGGSRPVRPMPRDVARALPEPGILALLSLRPWRTEVAVVIGYLVVTRILALSAAKIGIEVGPVPLFLTDLALLALAALAVIRRPGRLLFWASSGTQAGAAGFAVWILCLIAVVYFIIAFPDYRLFAVRDLAIFGYSLLFPLTYFAIPDRTCAVRTTRYFVYAGVVAAALILIEAGTGIKVGIGGGDRVVLGTVVTFVGDDDFGGVVVFSLAGLMAYLLFERRHKSFHLAAGALCFMALAEAGTRSAFVGFMLAWIATFLLVSHRYRLGFVVFATVLAGALTLGATLPNALPGAAVLHRFYLALMSATGGQADPNAAFRIARWKDAIGIWLESPLFGVGFGRNILHAIYLLDWSPGKFNLGMPHNTFLFLLARMGIVGFGLVAFSWVGGVWRLARAARRSHMPDDLAAVNILVAMAGFAAFVLFFERPMNNASFWIMLAVAQRLAETSWATSARVLEKPSATPLAPQSVRRAWKTLASNATEEQPKTSDGSGPSEDEIRKRAYEIHLARIGASGNESGDWLKAEAELKEARRLPQMAEIITVADERKLCASANRHSRSGVLRPDGTAR